MNRPATPSLESPCQNADMTQRGGILPILGKRALAAISSPAVWIPAIVLIVLTLLFRFTDADRACVRPFFSGHVPGDEFSDRWPLMLVQPWRAIYDWSIYPAWIIGAGGIVVWITSFFWLKLEPWRDPGLFYALLLLLGPGILVNGVLKPYWGRPRPNALVEFGGQREFLPVWQCGIGQDESSFPSGHASMGFFLMAPAFVCYRRRPRRALAFLLLGLTCGAVIGLARVVVGGHFPSDVLWSGGFVYFLGLAIAQPFKFSRPMGGDSSDVRVRNM